MIPYIIIFFLSCWVLVLFNMVTSSLKSNDKNISEEIRWNGCCLYAKINSSNVVLEFYKTTIEHASEYGLICLNPLFIKKVSISDKSQEVEKKVWGYLEDYAKKNKNDIIFGNFDEFVNTGEKILSEKKYILKGKFFYKFGW